MSTAATAHRRLDDVLAALGRGTALEGLEPAGYARAHAAFEARSDQRRLIGEHLAEHLRPRGDGPVAVLSVGCGDGSVDAVVAAALLEGPGDVRYVGVEPYAGSARAFADRMGALRPLLDVEVHQATFESAPLADELFDVVLFVHSIYYVPDVAATLRAAHSRLRPGGELLVLSAPMAALNRLVDALSPLVEGRRQWFSSDVAAGLAATGLGGDSTHSTQRLDAVLDLSGADADVLDFTTQVRLSPEVREHVLAYLAAVALPGHGPDALLLPHPVDVLRCVRAP